MEKLSEKDLKIKELENKSIILSNVERFNEKPKSLIYVKNGFAITYSQEISHLGILKKFTYEGYLIDDNSRSNCADKYIINMDCDLQYDEKHKCIKSIYISDFIADELKRDQGYGGIIMNCLIEYAQKLKVEYIYGELSFVDIGKDEGETDIEKIKNRERLYHFYPKYGFVITDNRIERTMLK